MVGGRSPTRPRRLSSPRTPNSSAATLASSRWPTRRALGPRIDAPATPPAPGRGQGAGAVACGGGGECAARLLFVSTRDGDYAIFAMNADGARQKRLTEPTSNVVAGRSLLPGRPAWSPDGAKIAFASRRTGTPDIYVMRADGTGTQRLTATRVDDTHPDVGAGWTADRVQARRRHLRHEGGRPRRTRSRTPGIRQRSSMVSGRKMDRVHSSLVGHPNTRSGSCGPTARIRSA